MRLKNHVRKPLVAQKRIGTLLYALQLHLTCKFFIIWIEEFYINMLYVDEVVLLNIVYSVNAMKND